MIDFYSRDFRNIYLKGIWNSGGGPPGMKSVVSRSPPRVWPLWPIWFANELRLHGVLAVWASLPDPACLRRNETWSLLPQVSPGDRNSGPVDGCATGPFSFADNWFDRYSRIAYLNKETTL
jgi:hypothetical protein